jgi:RNA polymerase sigma-70 factor (ECF subfamily)
LPSEVNPIGPTFQRRDESGIRRRGEIKYPDRDDQTRSSGVRIDSATYHLPARDGSSRIYLTHQLFTNVQVADHVFREGNVAFEHEALPWIDDVYRFALSLTRDEADADDVVQDTFLRAYRSWHTYLPGSDCRRWLFTICRNVFLRSRERARPTVELESSEVDAIAIGSNFSTGVHEPFDDIFSRLDLAPAIHKALAKIPEPFRSALVIVDVEDQSYESAAEILGVPIGTVRSRLFRGRRLMQEYLLDYAADAGFRPHPVPHPALANHRTAA